MINKKSARTEYHEESINMAHENRRQMDAAWRRVDDMQEEIARIRVDMEKSSSAQQAHLSEAKESIIRRIAEIELGNEKRLVSLETRSALLASVFAMVASIATGLVIKYFGG